VSGPREVRAPRGPAISSKGWQQEAALRMLMNNLDAEVAENPDELVVYGGTGRAARSWEAFDAILRSLRELDDDETLLIQSGKPVGVFRTHQWSPRVLIANSNLVGEWDNWEQFRRLEAEGLTMYGQMTAGSWIYIGSQGIVQGTYECFAEIARRRFDGSLAGTISLTAGLGGMGGAQPLAITMNGGVALCVEVDADRLRRRIETGYLDEEADDLEDAIARCRGAKRERRALSVGLVANAADVLPALQGMGFEADIVTDQTSAHDPLNGYVPNLMSLEEALRLRAEGAEEYVRRSRAAIAAHCAAMVGFLDAGAEVFDYGNSLRAERSWAGSSGPSRTPASSPPTSDRCSATGRARSAGSPSPAIRRTSPRPTGRCSMRSPTTSRCGAGSPWPRRRSPIRACLRESAGRDTGRGRGSACGSTNWSDPARCRRRS
jgi:urocanate hydratase